MERSRSPQRRAGAEFDPKAGRPASQRQLRVGELVRHILSDLLCRDVVHDPDLLGATITVSEVRVSPDLKNATVFVLPLAGRDAATITAGLNRAAPYLRGQVSREMAVKFTPKLTFTIDQSFDEADRIRALLNQPAIKADWSHQDDDDED